jgi:hypothetical protein
MMELAKTNLGTEAELGYEEDEEMASIKSTDGHEYRVQRDVNKTHVNILFDEDPTDHKTDRPISKAMKRAQQRRLVREHKSASTPSASMRKMVTLATTSPRTASTSTAASKAVASTAPVKAATIASTTEIKPTANVTQVVTEEITSLVKGRSEAEEPNRGSKAPICCPDETEPEDSTTCSETWLI